ncbi:MAG: sulfotransferase [Actinomycetota bacterium]
MPTTRRELRKSLQTNFRPGLRDRLGRGLLRARQAINLPALVAGGRLERPVFIVGAPRSGSSLLHSILVSSRQVGHWSGEAHEVWEAEHHPALRDWESNVLEAADATPEVRARIRRQFFLATGPRRRFLEKTPRNALRIPFIEAIFPDAFFIHLKRDGRDNVNSLINAWRTPRYRTYRLPQPHRIPGVDPNWWKFVLYPGWQEDLNGPLHLVCAKQWIVCNDRILEAEQAGGQKERWTSVRYEDLVADPVAQVSRLLDFIGLESDSEVVQAATALATRPVNIVTPPEIGKWRRENPDEIAGILPLIASTMQALGYDVRNESVSE